MFSSPGGLAEFTPTTQQAWNDMIVREITRHSASRFFEADPAAISDGQTVASVRWSAAPAEPRFCLNRDWALKLSDWGTRGRHETQNEYCEYRVTTAVDTNGRVRPKRVVFSSELREYWVTLATLDPPALQNAAENVLGRPPTWHELYGHPNPTALTERQRRVRFSQMVAGHGRHRDLMDAGVLAQPAGPLNRDNVLFMTHPINGLDDLIYIVMFGATPYRVDENGHSRKALLQEIFRHFDVEPLACRNADPAAAAAPFDNVSEGRQVAFAQPLGMYLRPLNADQFEYKDQPLPSTWIKYSRGQPDMYQRLVFGPDDDTDAYLDDIVIKRGAAKEPLVGGYQIAEVLEVGPLVVVGSPSTVTPSDVEFVPAAPASISCVQANVCRAMRDLKAAYEMEVGPVAHGVRGIAGPTSPR